MKHIALALAFTSLVGCSTEDIPQGHKGRMFDSTGLLALYSGGGGLSGPVLDTGTYFTGIYDSLRKVECGQVTKKEPLTALTKDGVQFGLDVYARYNANCKPEAVKKILDTIATNENGTVPVETLYQNLVRPALGEAMRSAVAPFTANEINNNREGIFHTFEKTFRATLGKQKDRLISVPEVTLSNLGFPVELMKANVARAEQAVLKDKAIAEKDRIASEVETAVKRKELAAAEGEVDAAKIDKIGAALKRNPEYLAYQMQTMLPGIYTQAGEKGNLVLAAPSPTVMLKGGGAAQ